MAAFRSLLVVGLLCGLALFSLTGCPVNPPNGNEGEGEGEGEAAIFEGEVILETTDFTTNTTLVAGTYFANSDVSVSGGATLTLLPGVTIKFASGKDLTVESSGKLSAIGTASRPIRLTGQESTRGYWGGLRFNESNSTVNRLEYVTIEYGGGWWDGDLYLNGSTSSPSRVAVLHCILRESSQFGFVFSGTNVISPFTANTITSNKDGAGRTTAELVGSLDTASSYSGNDTDLVSVDTSGNLTTDTTFKNVGIPYEFPGDFGVHAKLTLSPGVRLHFAASKDLSVYSDGSLSAVGTNANPITLTGVEATRGYWGGLRFTDSNSPLNRLEYVTIQYGGGWWDANLVTTGGSTSPSQVAINNCIFEQSKKVGFKFDTYSDITEFTGNSSSGNELGAATVAVNLVGLLNDSGPYSGNDKDAIHILVSGTYLDTDATWNVTDADYQFGDDLRVTASLTLGAGTRLVFDSQNEVTVGSTGKLVAVGTAASPIVFTGLTQTAGFWGGLRFDSITIPGSTLDYVTVEYGGGWWRANLDLVGTWSAANKVTVTNSHFASSGKWGIRTDSATNINADAATANTFVGNVDGTITGL